MTGIIDIHPHVISTDTRTYPRAPIGGHQSDWSQARPVTYEQMIVEQNGAGIAKAMQDLGVDPEKADPATA